METETEEIIEKEENNDRQEKEIFQENVEIKKLIDSLKETENPTDETQTQ